MFIQGTQESKNPGTQEPRNLSILQANNIFSKTI
jgi:hypothetical protein